MVSVEGDLSTDFRPVPVSFFKRDAYCGLRDICFVNERDVRVPLPFLDSSFDFGAPLVGDRAEEPKCDLVTRITDLLRLLNLLNWLKSGFPQTGNRSDLQWVVGTSEIGYINDLVGLRRVGCRRHVGEKCIERTGFKVGFRMLINEEAESEYKYQFSAVIVSVTMITAVDIRSMFGCRLTTCGLLNHVFQWWKSN